MKLNHYKTAYPLHQISNFFFAMLFWIPALLLPTLSYLYDGWWFVFGFIMVGIGGYLGQQPKSTTFLLFTLIYLVDGVQKGFCLTHPVSFFYLCTLFGFLCSIPAHYYKAKADEI